MAKRATVANRCEDRNRVPAPVPWPRASPSMGGNGPVCQGRRSGEAAESPPDESLLVVEGNDRSFLSVPRQKVSFPVKMTTRISGLIGESCPYIFQGTDRGGLVMAFPEEDCWGDERLPNYSASLEKDDVSLMKRSPAQGCMRDCFHPGMKG